MPNVRNWLAAVAKTLTANVRSLLFCGIRLNTFWGKGSIRTLPALNQQSVSLDILMASSISIPKYLMVLSIFV